MDMRFYKFLYYFLYLYNFFTVDSTATLYIDQVVCIMYVVFFSDYLIYVVKALFLELYEKKCFACVKFYGVKFFTTYKIFTLIL